MTIDYIALIIAGVAVIIILLIGLLVIPSIYRKKHPEKFYNGPVYEVTLKSITPDIIVRKDLTREQNLITAARENVAKLMVQQTSSEEYYREVLTGTLIPIATLRIRNNIYAYDNYDHFLLVEWIYLYNKRGDIEKTVETPLKKVTGENLEKYIEERKGTFQEFSSFNSYLESLFAKAEIYYKESQKKNEVDDEEMISEILKKYEDTKSQPSTSSKHLSPRASAKLLSSKNGSSEPQKEISPLKNYLSNDVIIYEPQTKSTT